MHQKGRLFSRRPFSISRMAIHRLVTGLSPDLLKVPSKNGFPENCNARGVRSPGGLSLIKII
jgi:hypothetical protein